MAQPEEKAAIRDVMFGVRDPVIVELGARTGEDEGWIREACRYSPGLYLMVEPDMRNCQKIMEDSGLGLGNGRRLILGACASYDGLITFYGGEAPDEHRSRTSGSIRRPTGHLEALPDYTFPEELRTVVPCFTLDTIYKRSYLQRIDLLWVDIQGAERDMIAGGQHALEHTRYLFMEAGDFEFYAGQALKPELLEMFSGWKLLQDFGDNMLLFNPNMIEGCL
jgi:2-O-methyltransferase